MNDAEGVTLSLRSVRTDERHRTTQATDIAPVECSDRGRAVLWVHGENPMALCVAQRSLPRRVEAGLRYQNELALV